MNIDPKEAFHRACIQKYHRGIMEHRGGDHSLPFSGELFQEYRDEQLDSVNYLFDMLSQGKISEAEYDYAFNLHFSAWWWARERDV